MQGINDQELQGDFDKYINQTLDRDSLEKKLKRFIINGAKGQQPLVEPDSSISNIVSNVNPVDNNTVHKVTDDVSVIVDEASTEVENSMANGNAENNREKQPTNEEQITIRSVDRPEPIIGAQL